MNIMAMVKKGDESSRTPDDPLLKELDAGAEELFKEAGIKHPKPGKDKGTDDPDVGAPVPVA